MAVSEKQKYISRVKAAIYNLDHDKSFLDGFEEEMDAFDDDLTKTLNVLFGVSQKLCFYDSGKNQNISFFFWP